MRMRIPAGAFLVIAIFCTAAAAIPGDHVRQSAVAYLHEPTLIGTTLVQGPVLFVHDMDKMARGEPCTTIYLFDPEKGPTEQLVSFRCIPKTRKVVPTFTVTTRPNVELGFGCILTEYQFAGDAEGHGVPTPNPIPVDREEAQ